MRTKKAIIACLAVAICLSSFLSAGCGKNGWVTTDEGTFYYEDGQAYAGLKVMPDGTVRYFDPATFAMAKGEQEIDGNNYLFNDEGVMQTGFQTTDGVTKYYNPETGILMTGWLEIDGKKYYADPATVTLSTGLTDIEGKQYFFDETSGVMTTGWVDIGEDTYFFEEETGAGKEGIIDIDGKTYGFIDGKMIKGQRAMAGNHLYYFGEDGAVYREIDGDKPMVALTYDDGPSIYTNEIIDVFVEYNQRCTFFIVGDRISWNEEPAVREAELGFEQGNHTYSHSRLTDLDAAGQLEALKGTDDELIRISGNASTCLRPPEGRWDETLKEVCGQPIILWSIDSEDWKSRDCDTVCSRIIGKVSDGDIVLMHDLYQSTADATKEIVPALVDAGFQCVTVEELGLLRCGGLEDGVVYYSVN
ncbi:MAG: polysaccharide deacetylase family protein [Saccharofermentans sp.]|nr:polysaccharide deacetylase family protein [Saccharofermentans sp.]